MPRKQLKRLLWPAAGVDRSLPFQDQPPYSTPFAVNVRLRDAAEHRQRGGSRPGMVRAYRYRLGLEGGSPVNLLVQWQSSVDDPAPSTAISAGGKLYFRRGYGNQPFTEVNMVGLRLNPMGHLEATARGHTLYIANYGIGCFPLRLPGGGTTALQWGSLPLKGTVPGQCHLVAIYHDRMVLAGYPENMWYMSRLGEPRDWKFDDDPEDPARAIEGVSSDAGVLADALTALIPWRDETLLFGCERSLWVLQGDPGYGGRIENVSYDIGILGPQAWCRVPTGELVFLSRDGLYALSPAGLGTPVALSRDRLPTDLLDTDPTEYAVQLAYDTAQRGIHIFRTR